MGDALPTWLTVAELARRLDRPHSTIRSWRDRYRAWVPVDTNEDGVQVLPAERVAMIANLAAQRLTPREIAAELERQHGTGPPDEAPTAEPWQHELVAEVRRLRIAVERLADHFAPAEDADGDP